MNLEKRLLIVSLLGLIACSSYHVKPDITPEERFVLAKRMFTNNDYFEAKSQFKILILNNPGAVFSDEAQYFLGECHFNMKEYILATDEYGRLARLYPRSKWVDDALFKTAMCDFKLSPKSALDQTYTFRAVENFQRFLEDFPESDLVPEAERRLKICRTKLSKKDYKAGELYRKMGDFYGATIYFDSVLKDYYDTKFAEPAIFWKGECLYKLQKNTEARQAFEEMRRRYPDSEFAARAKKRLEEIDTILMKSSSADRIDPTTRQTTN
ncbi:MAG: outer membrane protein assembly factor BamD [Caldithrix sp.]|nr:MAG: outer membrane protein assembly factor BamD [Caldithrix sp.]